MPATPALRKLRLRQIALLHFMQADNGNWTNPHPLFDCNAYLRANPSLAARRLNPLIHYLRSNRDQAPASEGGYFGAA